MDSISQLGIASGTAYLNLGKCNLQGIGNMQMLSCMVNMFLGGKLSSFDSLMDRNNLLDRCILLEYWY